MQNLLEINNVVHCSHLALQGNQILGKLPSIHGNRWLLTYTYDKNFWQKSIDTKWQKNNELERTKINTGHIPLFGGSSAASAIKTKKSHKFNKLS